MFVWAYGLSEDNFDFLGQYMVFRLLPILTTKSQQSQHVCVVSILDKLHHKASSKAELFISDSFRENGVPYLTI